MINGKYCKTGLAYYNEAIKSSECTGTKKITQYQGGKEEPLKAE